MPKRCPLTGKRLASSIEGLTKRDQDVAILLLKGWDNLAMAQELGVSRRTIKAHFKRLFVLYNIVGGIKRVKLAVKLYRQSNGECLDEEVSTVVPRAWYPYRSYVGAGTELSLQC